MRFKTDKNVKKCIKKQHLVGQDSLLKSFINLVMNRCSCDIKGYFFTCCCKQGQKNKSLQVGFSTKRDTSSAPCTLLFPHKYLCYLIGQRKCLLLPMWLAPCVKTHLGHEGPAYQRIMTFPQNSMKSLRCSPQNGPSSKSDWTTWDVHKTSRGFTLFERVGWVWLVKKTSASLLEHCTVSVEFISSIIGF